MTRSKISVDVETRRWRVKVRAEDVSPLVLLAGGVVIGAVCFLLAVFVGTAHADGVVGWSVHSVAEPSSFAASDSVVCEVESQCDRYQLEVLNAGDAPSVGKITLRDVLPAGITTQESHGVGTVSGEGPEGHTWTCNEGSGYTTVTCELEEPVAPGHYAPFIDIIVAPPTEAMTGALVNSVRVEGGGPTAGVVSEDSEIGNPAVFEVNEFGFEPGMTGGASVSQAGAHPWELTTSLGVPSADSPPKGGRGQPGHYFEPPRNFKNVAVELPAGLIGDPLATVRCEESELRSGACPADSQVGVFGILQAGTTESEFSYTGLPNGCCSAVYNMVPEAGYPAEFGFTYAHNIPIIMYASLVHTGTGYRIRVTVPGVPVANETLESNVTFFGEPGLINGTGSTKAFLSDPSDCSAGPEGLWSGIASGEHGTAKGSAARVELEPWGEPGDVVSSETSVFPQLTGCDLLTFSPALSFAPSPEAEGGSGEPDSPSAFTSEVSVQQSTEFSQLATPDLREAVVKLPEGVTINPPAGEGLEGCEAEGPDGINIGSDDVGPGGRDEGDPEATELGEGHAGPGGDSSPYDDGYYHTAPGHCPAGSAIGTVEVFTPLLATRCGGAGQQVCAAGESGAPLLGKVFVAEPTCGEAGEAECREVSAMNGELFGIDLEVKEVGGDGSIVKLAGSESVNPQTGQLTASFKEDPQFPFSRLILHLRGGNRAPLATPQLCGSFTTPSVLTS
jgi:hypothetical protein